MSDPEVSDLLRRHGVGPTPQRVAIARVLFERRTHVSAEELYRRVNATRPPVSKATVYNTLGLLADKGLIRAVIADPERVFYDPNTSPHHHFYDETTGELTDIDASDVEVSRLPLLPEGVELQGIDVVIRVRRSAKASR